MLILHTILTSTLLFITTCLQSMERLTEYSLTSVPDDVLMHIFSYCPIHYYIEHPKIETYLDTDKESQALLQSIHFFLRTRDTCQRFHKFLTLKTIGDLFKPSYRQSDKNFWFKFLMVSIKENLTFETILIHAGADLNTNPYFISYNVRTKNTELIELFFKYPDLDTPFFFYADTVEQAQSFIDRNVAIHKTDKKGLNVLWHITNNEDIPAELIELYLEHKVNAENVYPDSIIDSFNGEEPDPDGQSCLLHACAGDHYFKYHKDATTAEKNTIKKILLLLDAIPHLINQVNTGGKTPLDVAYKSLKRQKEGNYEADIKFSEHLAVLFRNHGGLTAQELKQKETDTLIEKDSL